MKTSDLKIKIERHTSANTLNNDIKKLLFSAKEACNRAYAPYSSFYVGAAVLLANGEIIKGCNIENVAYPSGMCAERVALYSAQAQYPNVPVLAIAISALDQNKNLISDPIRPCGSCIQVLTEYEKRYSTDIQIIMDGDQKIEIAPSLSTLLPLQFDIK